MNTLSERIERSLYVLTRIDRPVLCLVYTCRRRRYLPTIKNCVVFESVSKWLFGSVAVGKDSI